MPAIDLHSPSPSSSASAWSGRRLSARFAAAWVAACLTAAGHAAEPAKVGPADAHWDAGAGTLQLSPAGESGARFELLALEFKIDGQWVTTAAGSPTISERNTHGLNFTVDVPSASAMRGRIRLDPVEEIYGFGETWNGRVAQRGTQIEIWNHNGTPDECAYLPYFVSTRNYAFLLDFGGRVHFDVGQTRADEIVFEAPTGSATFSVVFGDSIADTVSHVFQEFGAPALPPRWAFKPWFWLMSDPDQPSAGIDTLRGHHKVDMVDRLHNLDIPVGVVWMEPPWQTHRTSFVPNPEFSADLAGLIRDLNDRGVEVLAWTVPYTLPGSPNFPIAAENGYLARPAGGPDGLPANAKLTDSGELEGLFYNYIDFYNPEAFAWWKEEIKSAVDLGFAGFKLDAGQDLPTDARLHGGRSGATHHNAYALLYNQVFGEAMREKRGDDYLLIPRASWFGASAHSNFKWPGDLTGSFARNGLPSSVYSSIALAFSGVPFISTDIGGFAQRPAPEAVWLRWAQFGAMLPGMQTLHMPWWFSDEAVTQFRHLTWLHTEMTPFWMTLAHHAHETGEPLVRPLVWDYQADMKTWRVDDQFTIGNRLLVAPILDLEWQRDVYLPEGRWISFWNESQIHEGGQTVRWAPGRKLGYQHFPLYIREGTIMPLDVVNAVTGFGTTASADYLTWAIWPQAGTSSEFTLHDQGPPVHITVSSPDESHSLDIKWSATEEDFLLRILHGAKPRSILSSNQAPLTEYANEAGFWNASANGWWYDATKRLLWIRHHNNGTGAGVLIRPTR